MHKIEDFLQELASSLQVVKIYTDIHPKSIQVLDSLYKKLENILIDQDEITIGIVGGEFVSGKEIFFELSIRLKSLISDLVDKGIEKIIITRGVSRDELGKFIRALITKKDDIGDDFKEYFAHLDLENISIEKIKVPKVGTKISRELASLITYEDALEVVSNSFKNVLLGERVEPHYIKVAMKNMLDKLLELHWEFLTLTSIKRYDLVTFGHSLNVGILAMFFSSKLGFKKEDIFDIGISALFHDMGKIAISQKVVQKPAVLTEAEMKEIKSHTILGAEILLQYADSLGPLPAIVAFEHHLRYDLKGYPKLTYQRKQNIASSIVSLCDCYDALRERRSYKRDYPSEMIYKIMLKERGQLFDPSLFDKFFKIIGVYPVSTIVELDNGFVGVVREENEDDIFSPKVEIILPQSQRDSMLNLKENKEIHIECSLNPLTKGKDYLNLI